MELLEWFQLLNDLDPNQSDLSLKINNFLFIAYILLYFCVRRAAPLAAFFMCVLLVDNYYLAKISEVSMYMLVYLIYLYSVSMYLELKNKIGCVILALLAFLLAADSFFYGESGVYGTSETFIYKNIEYLSLFAHILFISSFISIRKIRNNIRNIFNYGVYISHNSAGLFFY